ncbi:M56 family metallopeptidase [Solihabitans fulvus]|uniref:M56 family metallopeptidase n=1 Tax=Solihabitans fulvus TaxID=1892852 RepID=A0A5B2WU09_9PSEU|nr:M56 family metallopeptidase [Solihabitans fulvus]KAA2255483.1 M56 family metallopeptidase [Solihabitans fulvus]
MDEAVFLPLLMPLLTVPAVHYAAAWWHPKLATWLLTLSSVILSVGSVVSLTLLALAGAAQVPAVASVGRWSATTVRETDAGLPGLDTVAGVLLVLLVASAGGLVYRRTRAISEAFHQASRCRSGSELLVLPHGEPVAYALPGRPGRIVVSRGMLATLDPYERRVLLAHERAHLANHHYLFVAVVDFAAALNPLLRPLRSTVRYSVERWADESAAEGVGSRHLAAKAVGKAALVSRQPAGRAWHSAVLMAATAGPVPRRVAALLTPPPEGRIPMLRAWITGLIVLAAAATVAGSALDAARDLHTILEMASN